MVDAQDSDKDTCPDSKKQGVLASAGPGLWGPMERRKRSENGPPLRPESWEPLQALCEETRRLKSSQTGLSRRLSYGSVSEYGEDASGSRRGKRVLKVRGSP